MKHFRPVYAFIFFKLYMKHFRPVYAFIFFTLSSIAIAMQLMILFTSLFLTEYELKALTSQIDLSENMTG